MPTGNDGVWTPAFELNLETVSNSAFQEVLLKIREWSDQQPPLGPLTLKNGWHQITPQLAEDFLRRNTSNRKVSLGTVKKYATAMLAGDWKETGQPLLFNKDGKAEDLQHRVLACYFGKVTFTSYVITDVPVNADLFAYIDDSKPRSPADALHTSGMNGQSPVIAAATKLAWLYDNNALGVITQPKIRDMSVREVLEYTRVHKAIIDAAHRLMGDYPRAAHVVGHKGVATFFIYKVLKHYDAGVLDNFMVPLGNGANLDEDTAVLALRNRLLQSGEEDDKMRPPRRLALLIKAFAMHVQGKKVGRGGLSLRDNEKYPRFETIQPAMPLAAE
jgi:hypothetical protein